MVYPAASKAQFRRLYIKPPPSTLIRFRRASPLNLTGECNVQLKLEKKMRYLLHFNNKTLVILHSIKDRVDRASVDAIKVVSNLQDIFNPQVDLHHQIGFRHQGVFKIDPLHVTIADGLATLHVSVVISSE